jgi:hypothetical protein
MLKPTATLLVTNLLFFLLLSAADAASFSSAATSFLDTSVPYGVVSADFDGDGLQDAAITIVDGSTNAVRLLRGDGSGAFTAPPAWVDLVAGSGPRWIVAADLNRDGKIDLVVANFNDNSVSVFLGAGDGTFTSSGTYTVGAGPVAVALGDFRGDGTRDDLAVLNSTANSVAILLNDGTGTMTVQSAANWPLTTDTPTGIAVGDFNGDDIEDIAVTRGTANKVMIFKGNGVGTFAAGSEILVGSQPAALVAADFNNDGIKDLAVLNRVDATIAILKGAASGTMTVSGTYAISSPADLTANPGALLAADLNRDGIADLAVVNNAKNSISVLTGKGYATFNSADAVNDTFSVGTAPSALASGDLNGSGNDLLVIGSAAPNNSFSVLLNTSSATPGLIVSPEAYDFGNFKIGHIVYASVAATIANPGTAALTLSSMVIAGDSDFLVVPQRGTCLTTTPTVAAGSSCTVELGFKIPITVAAATANLTITTNDAVVNPSATVPLAGASVSFDTPYTVSLAFIGRGGGTATFNPLYKYCPPDCSVTPPMATTISIAPSPAEASFLYGWTGCDWVSGGSCYVTVNSNKTITANFGLFTRRVKLQATIPIYTATVQASYAAAGNSEAIHTPAGLFYEDLDMNRDISNVSLSGGWDSGFTSNLGAPTILRSLTISRGSAILDNIVLQ